jgi:cation-transporting ATPase 13A3/4/5
LTSDIPTATLFYTPVVLSVVGSALIQLIFQVSVYIDVKHRPFYTQPFALPGNTFSQNMVMNYEDTVLFIVSIWQYLVVVIAFSVAKPFRKPIYSNYPFLVSIIMMVLMNSVFLFSPNPGTPPCYMDMGVEMCPNWPGNNPIINFFMLQPFTYMG